MGVLDDRSLPASRQANITGFIRKNKQLTRKGRERSSAETPIGRAAIHLFIKPLAEFITKELVKVPPPANLLVRFGRLDPLTLALITLAPTLDVYFYGCTWDDPRSWPCEWRHRVGSYLKARLEFPDAQVAVAIGRQVGRRGRKVADRAIRGYGVAAARG